MKVSSNSKKFLAYFFLGTFVIAGTYNAVVINSQSSLNGQDVRFAKRLDESYGIITHKREIAAVTTWQKLSVKQASLYKKFKDDHPARPVQVALSNRSVSDAGPSVTESVSQAAVKEDLDLSLTQVNNPRLWQQGITSAQFSGSLKTSNGVIESLNVSLPNSDGLSVSFSEMVGNVFEYDYNNELYSAMMYQAGENSYVVTLSNGPLEGTRLTFSTEMNYEQRAQVEEESRILAENNDAMNGQWQEDLEENKNVPEIGNLSMNKQETIQLQEVPHDQSLDMQDKYAQDQGQLEQAHHESQGFNFEQEQVL